MKPFLNVAWIIGLWLTYIAIFASYPIGIYHVYNKHSEKSLLACSLAFPIAMYYGFEMFWHEDKPVVDNTDWDKKLKGDVQVCAYLFTVGSDKNANVYEVNETEDKFSDKIKAYPAEKMQFLKDASRKYIRYMTLTTEDEIKTIDIYFETGVYYPLVSEQTIKLQNDLITNYKMLEVINNITAKMKEVHDKMNKDKTSRKAMQEIRGDYDTKVKSNLIEVEASMKAIFKTIFDESY